MPENRIKVRSPYYLKYSDSSLSYAELKIRIYSGSKTSGVSGTPKYTVKKYPIGSNNYVVFEIAELIRDYIDVEFNGTHNNDPVWVYAATELFDSSDTKIGNTQNFYSYCYDGFNLFEEGINYQTDPPVFISDRVDTPTSELTLYRPSGEIIVIPINADKADANLTGYHYILFPSDGSNSTQIDVTSSDLTSNQIKYINLSSIYNKVEIWTKPPLLGTETKIYTVHIEEMPCNKHEAIKVTFCNRYGALQDLWFTARNTQSLKVESEEYKSSMVNFGTLSYSVTEHQQQVFNKQGVEKIILNTGLVNEDYSLWMKELMLSEKVWMKKDGTTYPIKITSSNLTEKTSVNDKSFNYSIEAEYAFDKVQNIR